LTLSENIADAGGVRIAYIALLSILSGKAVPKIDGFTPEQRFFQGFAQGRCANQTDDFARRLATTDPHAPDHWRVNGVLSNVPEFGQRTAARKTNPWCVLSCAGSGNWNERRFMRTRPAHAPVGCHKVALLEPPRQPTIIARGSIRML
jgi:hypothetical protein